VKRDERGIIIGWFVKILLSLAILAVTVFEAGAIIVATVGVDGTADVAAREAALEYGRSKNEPAARKIAEDTARRGDAVLTSFKITAGGHSIIVVLSRTAKTKIAQHIGPLKKFTTPTATSESPIR
jgi:hypothetical protein